MVVLKNLTPEEERVLAMYKSPRSSDMARTIRLSIQYALIAGGFVALAIVRHRPVYSIGAFLMFVVFISIRLVRAKKIAGVMPRIIAKYEERITELEGKSADA